MHPYRDLPPTSFWRSAVAGIDPLAFDPVVTPGWTIGPDDAVMTAGSCFAQHVARALAAAGCRVPVLEAPSAAERDAGAQPTYTARYGNIYSVLQLLQLFERAYGLRVADEAGWTRPDGRVVDPFRPTEFPLGFADDAGMAAERDRHLAHVRHAFETCAVLVFTLGLTETWAGADGLVVPLAPGVVAEPAGGQAYAFRNLRAGEVTAALDRFAALLAEVNPRARILLTVSPVPLAATFSRCHVVTATCRSKAVLRVAAEEAADASGGRIAYFPSYEMVAAFPGLDPFADDRRTVRPEVVAHVMAVFRRHYVTAAGEAPAAALPTVADPPPPAPAATPAFDLDAFRDVACDEELLARLASHR